MKIETHISPNCSELGLLIKDSGVTKEDILDVMTQIRKAHLKVTTDLDVWGGIPTNDTLMAEIIMGKKISVTAKMMLIQAMKKKKIPQQKITTFLQDLREECFYIGISGNGGAVDLRTSDGCSIDDALLFETGDYEEENFPLLKKLEDIFGGEIYSIDGGHTDAYEKWCGEHDEV